MRLGREFSGWAMQTAQEEAPRAGENEAQPSPQPPTVDAWGSQWWTWRACLRRGSISMGLTSRGAPWTTRAACLCSPWESVYLTSTKTALTVCQAPFQGLDEYQLPAVPAVIIPTLQMRSLTLREEKSQGSECRAGARTQTACSGAMLSPVL